MKVAFVTRVPGLKGITSMMKIIRPFLSSLYLKSYMYMLASRYINHFCILTINTNKIV